MAWLLVRGKVLRLRLARVRLAHWLYWRHHND
jgi:hypothetical protein